MSNSLDQVRPDIKSGLIWVVTVCKSYQQTTLIGRVKRPIEALLILVQTNLFLKPIIFAHLCRLLITSANSLDPDQTRQNVNVGPDLDPNCLTL